MTIPKMFEKIMRISFNELITDFFRINFTRNSMYIAFLVSLGLTIVEIGEYNNYD